MKNFVFTLAFLAATLFSCQNQQSQIEIHGWNILSDHVENGYEVIAAAKEYGINHLQLSHHLLMDLRHVRDKDRLEPTLMLLDSAKKAGIEDVFVWDRVFYRDGYYPNRFLVDSVDDRRIDLDNLEFWEWFKDDYRDMFSYIPDVGGIILTFIETGMHVDHQYSSTLNSSQKLAMAVDTIANLVINELGKKVYIRTFEHNMYDLEVILGSLKYIQHPDLVVMVKETPHDFFNFHPVQTYIEDLKYPVIIEFDAAHEYNGHGIIANTFTQLILDRWKYYMQQNNVVGYVARTDRYGTTKIINRPSEVLLYALERSIENPTITEDEVNKSFISKRYGEETVPYINEAFKKAILINNASFYTLGVNSTDHSALHIENQSCWGRFIAGRFMNPPLIYIENNLNKEFHYFKDIIEHLSPATWKEPMNNRTLYRENPYVFDNEWVSNKEKFNETYLDYVLTEKDFAVDQAEQALALIEQAGSVANNKEAYHDLYETFNRTLIVAKLHRAAHQVFFGYRLYIQDIAYYKESVLPVIAEGMNGLRKSIETIENYPCEVPGGQWYWYEEEYFHQMRDTKWSDTSMAKKYLQYINETGWPFPIESDITIPSI